MTNVGLWAGCAALTLGCFACSSSLPSATPDPSTCKGENTNEPDLMAWEPGSRGLLKGIREQGLAVVRYEVKGCDVRLELLSNCVARGRYEFVPYWESDFKIARNSEQLFTELPLGAANLSGKVRGDRALRTDYMLTGMIQIPVEQNYQVGDLVGECSGATHLVSRMYLGGFAMVTGESKAIEASASVFLASAGGSLESSLERVQKAGDPKACLTSRESRTENPDCAVPLRLTLRPLAQHRECFDAAECEARCSGGAGEACVSLGVMYAEGRQVAKDPTRSAKLFKTACDQGVANGCANLGALYLNGLGVPQDYRNAEMLLANGCEHNVPWSCSSLAYMYVNRLSLQGDSLRAAELYQRACYGGDKLACGSSLQLWTDLCETGSGRSCFEAARERMHPDAPRSELKSGAEFLDKGCKAKHLDSCVQLSTMYIEGGGVDRDPARGIALLEALCAQAQHRACTVLGAHYGGYGTGGVAEDLPKATALLDRTCQLGDSDACLMFADLLSEGKGVPKDTARAVALVRNACNAGHPRSCTALASAYEDGDEGLSVDLPKALSLYQKACDGGDPDACDAVQRLKK